ncbi:MAG: phosphoglycolate phosphatase [Alteromonadaceae bacterium]|jgi:phosphoglycolate phosphatase
MPKPVSKQTLKSESGSTKYQAIAFDLDGTLVDSVPDLHYAANLMLNAVNHPPVSIDEVRLYIGDGIETLALRALSRSVEVDDNLDSALCTDATKLFKQFYLANVSQNSQLYANVTQTLALLAQSGLKLAVVTNKARQFTLLLLKALDIHHYFDIIVCGDDLAHKKPHPLPMLHTLQSLKLTPVQLLLVGDSKNDMLSAEQAGVDRVFVTYGYHQGIKAQDYTPKYIFDDFAQLQTLISN